MREDPVRKAARVVERHARDPLAACITDLHRTRRLPTEILVVHGRGREGIQRQKARHQDETYILTTASKRLFEGDIARGNLGEFVASFLLEPYTPITGREYLEEKETELKTRVIMEELENLALRYGDLLLEMLIEPSFFFHAKMQRRARIYPPLRASYLSLLRKGTPPGFGRALDELSRSGLIEMDEYIRITQKMMERLPKPGENVLTPFREVELAIRRLATYGIAADPVESPLFHDLGRDLDAVSENGFEIMPDPKSYVHLRTGSGLVTLDDKRGYRDLIAAEVPGATPRSITRIGGALNFVYLVEYGEKGQPDKVVAKTYQNWYGLKWIPLSIWTIGSQNFDILGERRLTNEYRMNRRLRDAGLNAPEIQHVSVPRRTIIEEYIPGRGFDSIVRQAVGNGGDEAVRSIAQLGEEMSSVHEIGVALGDSKPDNALVDEAGRVWFVDLEQASEDGSPSWDLAEFLYYSGHYSLRWGRIKPIVRAFIEGYLRNGDRRIVREISSARYKRIFGVMTAPHIVLNTSKLCRSYGASS